MVRLVGATLPRRAGVGVEVGVAVGVGVGVAQLIVADVYDHALHE